MDFAIKIPIARCRLLNRHSDLIRARIAFTRAAFVVSANRRMVPVITLPVFAHRKRDPIAGLFSLLLQKDFYFIALYLIRQQKICRKSVLLFSDISQFVPVHAFFSRTHIRQIGHARSSPPPIAFPIVSITRHSSSFAME